MAERVTWLRVCRAAAAVALSLLMTLVGSLVPTLRALRVDPIVALRSE